MLQERDSLIDRIREAEEIIEESSDVEWRTAFDPSAQLAADLERLPDIAKHMSDKAYDYRQEIPPRGHRQEKNRFLFRARVFRHTDSKDVVPRVLPDANSVQAHKRERIATSRNPGMGKTHRAPSSQPETPRKPCGNRRGSSLKRKSLHDPLDLQHPAVLDALETDGRYLVDPKNIAFPPEEDSATVHLHAAYQWLVSEMKNRIGPPPKGAEYPIWAWYKQYKRADGKPDMRQSGHAAPGEPLVRMKLDVPDNLVLLSDFGDWHFVLNYGHCSKTEEESVAFDLECESNGVSFHDPGNFDLDSPALRKLRKTIENSWDYILDVYAPRDENWHFPWQKRSIQATFWMLEKRHVLSVERFTAR